jgi:hypothetical protein
VFVHGVNIFQESALKMRTYPVVRTPSRSSSASEEEHEEEDSKDLGLTTSEFCPVRMSVSMQQPTSRKFHISDPSKPSSRRAIELVLGLKTQSDFSDRRKGDGRNPNKYKRCTSRRKRRSSTSVLEHSTSVPEHSTSVPEHSTSVPEHSTSVPEHSTSVPEHSQLSDSTKYYYKGLQSVLTKIQRGFVHSEEEKLKYPDSDMTNKAVSFESDEEGQCYSVMRKASVSFESDVCQPTIVNSALQRSASTSGRNNSADVGLRRLSYDFKKASKASIIEEGELRAPDDIMQCTWFPVSDKEVSVLPPLTLPSANGTALFSGPSQVEIDVNTDL